MMTRLPDEQSTRSQIPFGSPDRQAQPDHAEKLLAIR